MIKKVFTCFAIALLALNAGAQILPVGMTEEEKAIMPFYEFPQTRSSFTTPPSWTPRAMAEWEEIDVLLITWTSYTSVLRQIVDAAQEECTVLIACTDSNTVKSYLTSGGVPLTNVDFIEVSYNSVWIRDYGAHNIYRDVVGDHYLVDWEYNRPRPQDDLMPEEHAAWAGLDLYSMTVSPWDFIATGGNLMVDGFGTAMSSELIVDENPSHTVTEIDTIMKHFLGIDQYVLFPTLPYDGIHHIDMHMKLLDEETILVGEYPAGTSDGPQIEANLQWLLTNYMSCYGTPYRVVRIPMPKSPSSPYWPSSGGYYNTYTNGVFVNKTYIYPSYFESYDTTAYRIYSEVLPGYTLVPIDCYPDPISASGAIHCITNCISSNDPLLISHQRLADPQTGSSDYQVNAYIKHASGIASASIYYKTSLAGAYTSVAMSNSGGDNWIGNIPVQANGTKVYYYIQAQAVSGKSQVRPMPAPDGYWEFTSTGSTGIDEPVAAAAMQDIYPNPAAYITCIPVECGNGFKGRLTLMDATGRIVEIIHDGEFPAGQHNYFFNAHSYASGMYIVQLETGESMQQQKVIVRNF
ncbi:Peptidylarginine deiminase [bioreactor metagenome]|uniref:Peptidylarginine deiminase n=1 Tax=bioreactor metagenome TaxID=1076179 RepID=A0A644X9X2_9ZZZZ